MSKATKTTEYDVNVWEDGYGQVKIAAYQMFIDRTGLRNTDSQPADVRWLTETEQNELSERWGIEDLSGLDSWDVNGQSMDLPDTLIQWLNDLPEYEMETI